MNKKALSGLSVIVILFCVSLAAIVAFQNLYIGYTINKAENSNQNPKNSLGGTRIEALVGSDLYFRNGFDENITINSIQINNIDCEVTKKLPKGISEVDISKCSKKLKTGSFEVIVNTNKKKYSRTIFYKSLN